MDLKNFSLQSLADCATGYLKELQDKPKPVHPSGIESLDLVLGGGVENGEYCILGGRPSHGKTSLAMQWVFNVARRKTPTLIISEEMTPRMLGKRAIQYASDVPERNWKPNWSAVYAEVEQFFTGKSQIRVSHNNVTAERIVDVVLQAKQQYGVEFVVIDFIQRIRMENARLPPYERVTAVSNMLKDLAICADIGILCLAQLSRKVDEEKGQMPQVHHLKNSGDIEQDADSIVFVRYHKMYEPTTLYPRKYNLFCAKNKNRGINGPRCWEVEYYAETQRVSDLNGWQDRPEFRACLHDEPDAGWDNVQKPLIEDDF